MRPTCRAGLGALSIAASLFLHAQVQARPDSQILSAVQIMALFDKPADAVGLLRNLRIAADRSLPLQPAFDEDATLLKFFSGTAVRREHSRQVDDFFGTDRSVEDAFVTIDDPNFPHMTVHVQRGEVRRRVGGKGSGQHAIDRFGSISLRVEAVPEFNVCSVREVFGQESRGWHDSGIGADGGTYVPEVKGYLEYTSPVPQRPGSVVGSKKTTFTIELEKERTEVGWPSERERRAIHNRDQIRAAVIYVPEP